MSRYGFLLKKVSFCTIFIHVVHRFVLFFVILVCTNDEILENILKFV